MNVPQQQTSNSDVSWAIRKYNIAPEFLSSPYLKPIGFSEPEKWKQKSKEPPQQSKKSTRQRQSESDIESVLSFRTQRSLASQRSHQSHRSSSTKNYKILLPREIDKLCREFRQKHNIQHPILKNQIGEQLDDDTSTICSEFAESLDDEAVYLFCHKDPDVENALFPNGPLFAEMAYRNAIKDNKEPVVKLPPIRLVHHEKASGDVSDLDSLHSGPGQGRRGRR